MEYETRNGFNVIKSGWVIIDEEAHYVKNFYVACSAALNHRAWNISSEVKRCTKCIELPQMKSQVVIFKSDNMKSTEAFKNTIQQHLEQRAAADPLFAKTYAKENKTIEECCNYIMVTVQKSGCNGFEDAEIYSMAVHYYDEDTIKDVKPANGKAVVNHTLPKEKPVSEETKAEFHKNYMKTHKAEKVEIKKPEPKKVSQYIQNSLFD